MPSLTRAVVRQQKNQQLLRQFIGQRLAAYYAQPAHLVVGSSQQQEESFVSFGSLWGAWHWRRVFQRLYDNQQGQWLTPVELFQPHYSHILADYIVAAQETAIASNKKQEWELVELGGGRGTNAPLILSYLQQHQPELYDCLTTYTLIDSSPTLHELQQQQLNEESKHVDKMRFQLVDLMDVADGTKELLPKSSVPTVVLGMELLDNLPHDKIQAGLSRKHVQQAMIQENDTSKSYDDSSISSLYEECWTTLSDPLLKRVIKRLPEYIKTTSYPTWIPSVACGVLDHVLDQRSHVNIVLADFDWLPAPDLVVGSDNDDTYPQRISSWGEGEPIVTDMEGKDHECFLLAPKECDILFPTDFDQLATFVRRRQRQASHQKDDHRPIVSTKVWKQSAFLERYGADHIPKTKSWLTGHSPLLDDFSNCSVLTVSSTTITANQKKDDK